MGAQCLNEGDVYGLHNDDLEGRFGGLSFTSYFTQKQWKSEWGGYFVWCADPKEPITIPPLSNIVYYSCTV
jgi:Rps23 Pro-64 3,4-dihydroxylase Tpa1-like proline 4-hydroxylase